MIGVILVLLGLVEVAGQAPIAIGIVREDGHLFPITLVPPRPIEDARFPLETFINGSRIPEPEAPIWPFKDLTWTLPGGRPLTFKTLEPVMVQMPYGEDRLMWRTTLKGRPVRKGYVPIPKIGAAVTAASIELPEDVVSEPDDASRRVARRIESLFQMHEKSRLAEERGRVTVPQADEPLPVVIEQLKRHAVAGVTTYYFEATRSLKLSDGAIVPDAGLVTGWIVDSRSGLKDFEVEYKVNDDSYKEGDTAIVRGIVPYQGKAVWILEWHGWESEYYTVHEWPSGVLLVTVDAYK
jgi:hypothetical protein